MNKIVADGAWAWLLVGSMLSMGAAHALTIRNLTTGTLLFSDNFEGAAASPALFPDTSGDFDPVASVGSWQITGDLLTDPEPASHDIQVTSSALSPDPFGGAYQGTKYLRVDRSTSTMTGAYAKLSSPAATAGDWIRVEGMFGTARNLTTNGGIGLRGTGNQEIFSINLDNDGTVDIAGTNSGLSHSTGQWNHVVFDYHVGASRFDLSVNGEVLTDVPILTANPPTSVESLRMHAAARTGSSGTAVGPVYVDAVTAKPTARVDRTTGNVTLQNLSGTSANIVGYTLLSPNGALNANAWTTITDNYDANSGGSVDNNDIWLELVNAATNSQALGEIEFGTVNHDGATLANNQSINLGNVWLRGPFEDVQLEVLFGDGTVLTTPAYYVGASPLPFGDLDLDGDIDVLDFRNALVPNFGMSTASLPGMQRYLKGDLNDNGSVDLFDFLRLNSLYTAANPGAGALSLEAVMVPEPSSIVAAMFGFVAFVVGRFKPVRTICGLLLAVVAGIATPAEAVTVRNLATGEILFYDDFEGLANNVSHTAFLDPATTSGDFDPVAHVGTWLQGGTGQTPPLEGVEENIQVTDFKDANNPGAFQGSNYLRADRWGSTGEQTMRSLANLSATQTVAGHRIRLDMVYAIPTNATSSNAGFGLQSLPTDNPNTQTVTTTLFRNTGGIRSTIGKGIGSGDNDTTDPASMAFAHTRGEWARVTVEYTIGETTYDLTVNGITENDLELRWEFADFPNQTAVPTSIGGFMLFAGSRSQTLSNIGTGFADAIPDLSLLVNKNSGEVILQNDLPTSVAIDAYRLSSASGSLNPTGWTSLDDQDFQGNLAWAQLDNAATALSEGYTAGASSLASGAALSLGSAFKTTGGSEDLVLEVHLAGTDDAVLVESKNITYIDGLDGDYNGDGTVNLADYTVWRDALGSHSVLANDITPGYVSPTDYLVWKSNFGASGAGIASGLGVATVPEPATALTLVLALVGHAGWRRRLVPPT
ncbi:PEP-CTERM sorting domain-containing protein [Aeoliella sp. SH292]|uniref:PEP-CTERM sorting domain-containing protein n=1 Tax=Aeoliella sp. SH292 TaxID=3454464 RepID=UPI003F9BF31F